MARGNKTGAVHVKPFNYTKKHKRIHVAGYRRTRPGGKRGSQKKR